MDIKKNVSEALVWRAFVDAGGPNRLIFFADNIYENW